MTTAQNSLVRKKLEGLRTELIDLAFTLECQGRLDAADTAIMVSTRVGEVCEEFAAIKASPELEPGRRE